jgi:hypothetical protein
MSSTAEHSTSSSSDRRDNLLDRVRDKHREVDGYLRTAATQRRLLLNLTIIAGSCAAALTAGPALGGKSMAEWLSAVFGLSSPSWQLLCAAASVCSLAATIAIQLLKSHNVDERIARAQDVRARLEMLEMSIAGDELDYTHAASQYSTCIKDSSFVEK